MGKSRRLTSSYEMEKVRKSISPTLTKNFLQKQTTRLKLFLKSQTVEVTGPPTNPKFEESHLQGEMNCELLLTQNGCCGALKSLAKIVSELVKDRENVWNPWGKWISLRGKLHPLVVSSS